MKSSKKLHKNHSFAFIMFVRRDKSQKMTMLTGWIVRYDGFIFGSNCSWGRKTEIFRCRTWKRNSGSTCQNHFILRQTNFQHQSNFFWTKKIENRLLTATVTSFSAFIWSNSWWSGLLKSKRDIYNLDPRQFYFRWSLLPMTLQSIKKPKKIWEVRFLTATVASFKAQKDQIGGEIHCRSYILSSSQKSPS